MTLMGEPYKPSQRAPATKAAAAPSKESEAMAEVRRLQAILGPAKPMVKTSAVMATYPFMLKNATLSLERSFGLSSEFS